VAEDDNYDRKAAVAALFELETLAIAAAVREAEESRAEAGAPPEVDHPRHYNSHPAGIECIDVVEPMGFNIGNIIKYAWRAGLKPGTSAVTDLQKARWYCDREIQRLTKGEEGP